MDSNADGDHDAGETVIARYEYDALNRRTKKHLNADTDDDFDTFPHFFYNAAWQILETRKSTSENTGPETLQPEYQYVWSLRYIDALVLRDKNTDTDDLCDDERLYFANDANMNVTALLEADGDVAERYVYDPYGNVKVYSDNWSTEVTTWSASKKNNIRFCGYYFDNETGLYNPRTRYYHPYFGWITRDGGYWDGMNLYQYSRSEPADRKDPSGLASEECKCGLDIDEALLGALNRLYLRVKRLKASDTSPAGLGGIPGSDAYNFMEKNGGYMDLTFRGRGGCPSGPGCEPTVTLCGTCVPSWNVNNIIYGFMARALGFSQGQAEFWADVQNRVQRINPFAGESISERSAYRLGRALGKWSDEPSAPNTVESMCATVRKQNVTAIALGGKLEKCKPCQVKATIQDVIKDFSRFPWQSNDGVPYEVPEGFPKKVPYQPK